MTIQRVLAIVGGAISEYVASALSLGTSSAGQLIAANAAGVLDVSFLPTGVGPEVQILPATEALSAGAFANIYSSAGSFAVRNADGSTSGKAANGFVLAAVAQGANATVYLAGINTSVTGQVPGPVWLSDTAVGQASATPPTTAGHTWQQIGTTLSATAIQFTPGPAITRS